MNNHNLRPVESRQTWTVRILFALILLIAGVYLYKGFESFEKVTHLGLSEEARNQPYLAAKMFLQEKGAQVALLEDYRVLYNDTNTSIYPQNDDSIVLTEGEIALSDSLASKILDWVHSGGHLVVALNATEGTEGFRANALVQRLNVGVKWRNDETFIERYPTEIINPDELPMMVNLESSYHLDLPENPDIFYTAGDDYGATFAQMDMGEGLITLLTDAYIWNNYQIGQEDNVVLLEQLVSGSPNVYIFSTRELPHWFTLLYDFAPYFIWFGGVLLVFAMWHWALRFGPIQNVDEHKYTPFSLHIKAAGEFYWRLKRQTELTEEIRHSIIVALHKKRPATKSANKDKLLEQLSQISGWPIDTINSLMFSQTLVNETQFTQRIASLQTLRKML
ncbi:DUF4350 domain-containing protein [Aliiglaciecola lipolytica]|uniref:DUF4350 domain-containing protein n=1 Tax=Aliiglaciecola lipolytica E3 TaxID=1127673 RepID=K6YN90_9ALTE|nr:DUF4350 domain-containing protein [Aliiglaciecola lipolytica]GAC12785.1 hypothetical protein GLIP_0130 [Aliiglaciecola lipolytica E3]